MKLIKSIFGLFAGSAVVAAAAPVVTAGITQAVATAAAEGNPIGDTALEEAKALESTDAKGPEKKTAVVKAIVPLIVTAASKGGLAVLEADAEAFAGLVVEAVLPRLKVTPIGALASALLTAFGVKL